MNIVELKNVHKTYMLDEVELNVLNGIDLKVKKGEFMSIVGPSGSGKSTLLHIIGALDRPTKGHVFIGGKDTSKMDDNELAWIRGRRIGFVFQTFNLISRLTALENVILPMWFADFDGNRKDRAIELLKEVGLEKRINHLPTQLSGGERQRVAIARALVNNPDIIVADEPTGNLDSKTGKEIINIFKKIHNDGATLILVTHDLDIAKVAEREIHIKDGVIIHERR
ncbi:MAG: ABC transporter ATP-binding protein [Candidatus Aenigmatarchaeota archaeon]